MEISQTATALENRKIIAFHSIAKINNYMDDDFVAEGENALVKADTKSKAVHALEHCISGIKYRFDSRPECKDLYTLHLGIIENMKQEIQDSPLIN